MTTTEARTTTLPTIAFLGAGSMAGAILNGLLSPVVSVTGGIRVTSRTAEKAAGFAETAGVTAFATESRADANREAVRGAKLVVLAVKPYLVPEVLADVAGDLEPDAVVVSVAAGVTVATMEAAVPASVAVIRTMPNTPAQVGRGVTGVSAGSRASEADVALVRELFETVGAVVEVPESQLDALSTISGSGPAYVFLLIEEFVKTAIAKGFSAEQATLLVEQTFLGASELLAATGEDPAELRRRVTSPKGTTEKAVEVLQGASLSTLFDRATDAALARAQELAKG
ncbi:pyrroline-5-carboxylate reductase [Gryllotalpicola protaetiae]|uniref:Pyrroline-5-carboxylate reductase n=1 Tax=Gryllotalpicola protaetiae TaxID=2419771 RepID=A0A387BJ30_9MICO|nr:pyrroline-5-carboxylate reductase [Gryllotalpicola protaetiae]AYG03823.1 pyrroline-5-carboxylate reductase [Gryllotalpicola protaetiae]